MGRQRGYLTPGACQQCGNPPPVGRDTCAGSRLLTQQGADVAAMALDVANTIQAGDSSEKMLAHQLAAMHKVGMEMIRSVIPGSRDAAIHNRRLNAAVRCIRTYQQGLLTLRKLRVGAHQRISVQHVHVSDGWQAIVGMLRKIE